MFATGAEASASCAPPCRPGLLFVAPRVADAASLYDKLGSVILPLHYRDRDRFADVMRPPIALNGSFFNTHRMMHEYVLKAYCGCRVESASGQSVREETA